MLHDGQAQARAAGGARAARVHAEEPLEHALTQLRRNARSLVGHLKLHGAVVARKRHEHETAVAVVAHGVVYQVVHHLLGQARRPRHHVRTPACQLNRLAALLGAGLQAGGDALAYLAQVDRVAGAINLLVKAREGEHVVDERAHGGGLGADEACETRDVLLGHHTCLHELGVAADHLQGRLHLVAHVARELAAHVVGVLERHVLGGQLAVLRVHALQQRLQLAIGVGLRRARQVYLLQGLHDMAREQARHKRREHGHHHERRRDGPGDASHERRQRRAHLGQAQHLAVVEQHGCVERVGPQRLRAPRHAGLAVSAGRDELLAVGMATELRDVLPVVEEHLAVLRDERAAHVDEGHARKDLHHVRVAGLALHHVGHRSRLGEQVGLGVVLVHPVARGSHGQGDGHHHAERHAEHHGKHPRAQKRPPARPPVILTARRPGGLPRRVCPRQVALSHSQASPWHDTPRRAPSGCTPRRPGRQRSACGAASGRARPPCASRPRRLSPTRARAAGRG